MDDLITFLRARLDEDEQAARKAASLCGCHQDAPSWRFGDEATDGRILVADDPHPHVKRKLGRRWNGSYDGLFMAEHIARHDPARVLRDVDAKRQIIAECIPSRVGGSELELSDALGEVVLAFLALTYAGHPDYREEWRP